MNELHVSFGKIAAGLKTGLITKGYKAVKLKGKMDKANTVDAINMYPEDPSLAKKKSEGLLPLTLTLRDLL